MKSKHDSVLMKEILKALAIQPGDTVVDATLGGAGHFSQLLATLGEGGVIIGIDADSGAVERGREVYASDRRPERPVAHLVNDNFRNLSRILERLGIGQINAILFDLGWSGYQISAPRGFTFQNDEPLLMTYGLPAQAGEGDQTAAELINSSTEEHLADIIFTYGEERFARSIARAIVSARAKNRILTTGELVSAIMAGTPAWYHKRKIHPATKTFQALRIAVNDEIGALSEGLSVALSALAPNGRLAVISFHSIEDRIVKNMLRDSAHTGLGIVTTKKPIVPARTEILANHRARSAKMRVFIRSAVLASQINSSAPFYSYAQ